MSVHGKSIGERIERLFDLARRHAAEFSSPEAYVARVRYLAEHPTAILVLKCMDGRINFSVATQTPPGIIRGNMETGRIPDDDFLLLASVPYDEIGIDRSRAELESRFLARFAEEVINRDFPDLARTMFVHTAVLDWRSRRLETVVGDPAGRE